jgi:cytochrome b561
MAEVQRYHAFVIILHWLMALCFILMLASGIAMEEFITDKSLKFKMFQWHKSVGVLLLISFSFRVLARFMFKVPKLPKEFSKKDQRLAHFGHLALYFFMVALPLSGWVMVSSSVFGLPTVVFDIFTWPHVPGIAGNEGINGFSRGGHKYMGYAFIAMIVLHIAAVVLHLKKEKINLLKRMSFRG